MGHPQIFLLVLVGIVVGIAIIAGIHMFGANAASANMAAVSHDLVNLSWRAQQYYEKPVMLGGGSHSFSTVTITHLTQETTNENGNYSVRSTQPGQVVLGAAVELHQAQLGFLPVDSILAHGIADATAQLVPILAPADIPHPELVPDSDHGAVEGYVYAVGVSRFSRLQDYLVWLVGVCCGHQPDLQTVSEGHTAVIKGE